MKFELGGFDVLKQMLIVNLNELAETTKTTIEDKDISANASIVVNPLLLFLYMIESPELKI